MTSPSVRVSIVRVLCVASVLTLGMRWVGNRIHESMQSTKIEFENDWPTSIPTEANRVRAFNGVSMIAPEGWYATISEDTVEVEAPGTGNHNSVFRVTTVKDPYRHQRPLPRTNLFQEGHACVKILHIKTSVTDPTLHEAQVVVDRDGTLFEVSFSTYKHFTGHIPDRIWNYLETFEVSDRKLTAMAY